jgi:Tat protein secretion system quality control protein TatD with DNase activity
VATHASLPPPPPRGPHQIHSRDADEDTIRIMREEHALGGPFPAVMHCFTGGQPLAECALALGLYISFSGVVTFKRSGSLRAIAASVPLDRLLVETDCPNLAPVRAHAPAPVLPGPVVPEALAQPASVHLLVAFA